MWKQTRMCFFLLPDVHLPNAIKIVAVLPIQIQYVLALLCSSVSEARLIAGLIRSIFSPGASDSVTDAVAVYAYHLHGCS